MRIHSCLTARCWKSVSEKVTVDGWVLRSLRPSFDNRNLSTKYAHPGTCQIKTLIANTHVRSKHEFEVSYATDIPFATWWKVSCDTWIKAKNTRTRTILPYRHISPFTPINHHIDTRSYIVRQLSCHLASCHTCTCDPSVISNIAFISCCMVATHRPMI